MLLEPQYSTMDPLISVIIPLYNKGCYIANALDSILQQRGPHFEILVVDDGSTDDGPAIVRACLDNRLRLISQANSGVSSARNRGISEAKGRIICFLDGDDLYLPGYLAKIEQLYVRYPDAVAWATSYLNFDAHVARPKFGIDVFEVSARIEQDVFRLLSSSRRFFTGSIGIKASVLVGLETIFPVGESVGEDWDLWFRIGEIGPIAFLDSPFVAYRREVNGSLSSNLRSHGLLPAYARLRRRLESSIYPQHLRSSAARLLATEEIHLARAAFLAGNRVKALRALCQRSTMMGHQWYWWTTFIMALCLPRWIGKRRDERRYLDSLQMVSDNLPPVDGRHV